MTVIFILLLYYIGAIIYCRINRHKIGTNSTEDWDGDTYIIKTEEIVVDSFFWPFILFGLIIFSVGKVIMWVLIQATK
jgi:hypothetical protein